MLPATQYLQGRPRFDESTTTLLRGERVQGLAARSLPAWQPTESRLAATCAAKQLIAEICTAGAPDAVRRSYALFPDV